MEEDLSHIVPSELLGKVTKGRDVAFTGVVLYQTKNKKEYSSPRRSWNHNLFVKPSMENDTIGNFAENVLKNNLEHNDLNHKKIDNPEIILKSSYSISFWQILQTHRPWRKLSIFVKEEYFERLYESTTFNIILSLVILFNTFIICFQTNEKYHRAIPQFFQISDSICLIIFALEVVLNLVKDFENFWFNGWNIFDLLIVIISYVSDSLSFVTSFRLLRIIRLLKSLRIMKSVNAVRSLSELFNAFILSLKDVINVLILIILFMLCSALIGMSLFSKHSDERFGSLSKTLWTLVIISTQDGWLDPYRSLVEKGQQFKAMAFIFVFIWIGSVFFINTLVGVSANSLEVAKKQMKDEMKNEMLLDGTIIPKTKKKKEKENKSGYESYIKYFSNKKDKKNNNNRKTKNFFKMNQPPMYNTPAWEFQLPLDAPEMANISSEKLVHLYLCLSLIEENKKELSELSEKLDAITRKVLPKI